MVTFFDEISGYWTEIADARETKKQLNFVKKHIAQLGVVLDLGCGNGRHTIPLAKAGYEVVGLDISPRLLQNARNRAAEAGAKAEFVRSDMRCLPFRSETFSAVVSLDNSFGYFPTEEDALRTLKETTRTLSQKGLLTLDVFNREHMLQRHSTRKRLELPFLLFNIVKRFPKIGRLFRWREYPSFYMIQQRSLTKNGDELRDVWLFCDKKTGKVTVATHVVQLFSLAHAKALLVASGLTAESIHGNYDGSEYTANSDRLILISRKI